jgi:hypothetical protein
MIFIHKSEIPKDSLKIVWLLNNLKRKKRTNSPHSHGNLHRLPVGQSSPHDQLNHGQTTLQLHPVQTRSHIPWRWPREFLTQHSPEYMRLKFDLIPKEIIHESNLHESKIKGWVYVCINLGMYGLPHAGILANKLLAKHLAKAGYYQCQYTPGL